MKTVADTIIRSYEKDLKSGIAPSLIRRHANNRVRSLRKQNKDGVADKLEVWINSTL